MKISFKNLGYEILIKFTDKKDPITIDSINKKIIIYTSKDKFNINRYETLLGKAIWHARDYGIKKVTLVLQKIPLDTDQMIESLAHAAVRATRIFDHYKSDKKSIKRIEEVGISGVKEKPFYDAMKVAESSNFARDLVDKIPEEINPETFAKEAKKIAKKYKLKCTILDEAKLKKLGYNGMISVGKGGANKPKMITLEYKPKNFTKSIALIGKGITFDSGGYGIKPAAAMYDMKADMGGAAAVLGAIEAAAKLELKINLIGILCCAENLINEKAYLPFDIIKMGSGKTVEVIHTDAEGRLVLADGLYHSQKYKPDFTIDIATLTGASMAAFGRHGAAIMGNDEPLIESLIDAGKYSGERLWQLPLWEEHAALLESTIADLRNLGKSNPYGIREGDCSIGGHFLSNFAKGKWAHIDMGGPVSTFEPLGFTEYGATGFGVRLLVDWLKKV